LKATTARHLTHTHKNHSFFYFFLYLCARELVPFGKYNHLESGKNVRKAQIMHVGCAPNEECWARKEYYREHALCFVLAPFKPPQDIHPWLLWWRSFSHCLISFPSNPPVLLRTCLSFFFSFCSDCLCPSLFSFLFFPHTNNSCLPVPLILRYLQWQHRLVNAEKAHEFYMALVQFQQLVPEGCAISFQNGWIQKPFGQQLMRVHFGCVLLLWQDFKDGENGLI